MAFSTVFRRFRQPSPQEWVMNGWRGMYDTGDDALSPDEAPLLINFMPSDTTRPGHVSLRGARRCHVNGVGVAPRLGSGAHKIQYIGTHSLTSTGGPTTYAVVDGEIWRSSLGVWSKAISTADLTAAGCAMSATFPAYIVSFNNSLVVISTYQSTKPFSWTGVPGGGLTLLTSAPNNLGGGTVYYAKLFLFSNTTTIYWSEENQPNTGYVSGGFNNAWDLQQTSTEPIQAILGTNEALYFFRRHSVGSITGAVTSTFKSDGVIDGIHGGEGVDTPAATCYTNNTLMWWTDSGRIYAYRPGLGTSELTSQIPRAFGQPDHGNAAGWAFPAPPYNIGEPNDVTEARTLTVVPQPGWVLAEAGDSSVQPGRTVWVYDTNTLRLLSVWTYGLLNMRHGENDGVRFCCVESQVGGDTKYLTVDDAGYVFEQAMDFAAGGRPDADQDELGAAMPITGTILGAMHGHNATTEWRFTQIHVLSEKLPANNVGVGYITSKVNKYPGLVGSEADSGVTGTPYEKRTVFGINAVGRWIRPVIRITGSTSFASGGASPATVYGYTVVGAPSGKPLAPIL